MKWLYLACFVGSACIAQLVHAEAVWEEEQDDSTREVIRMTVTPADEPVPAFKYRLTLRPHEFQRGNSVAHYMRAFPEGGIERLWRTRREELGDDEFYAWLSELPISQLPLDKLAKATGGLDSFIDDYFEPASRCRDTDWGVAFEDIKGPEIVSYLLPEIQSMRLIGRFLELKTRLHIAERRYEDAIELMRINYRLGRDVGTQPILVSGLVGISIHFQANRTMIDLMAAPDSPNMYWALSALPRPQVSLRDAMRLELAIGPRLFKVLDHPERQQHTYDEWNALWQRDCGTLFTPNFADLTDTGVASPSPQARAFASMGFALAGYSHAKERLVAWGYKADEVEQMAVGQVMAIYQAGAVQRVSDEMEKIVYVDSADCKELERKANEVIRNARPLGSSPDRELVPVASMLLSSMIAVRKAGVRSERELEALRVIEALRIHAARNDGRWPARLDEITCVPVPKNPATGKPFEYSLDGDMAVLMLPMSDGLNYQWRFELKIAK